MERDETVKKTTSIKQHDDIPFSLSVTESSDPTYLSMARSRFEGCITLKNPGTSSPWDKDATAETTRSDGYTINFFRTHIICKNQPYLVLAYISAQTWISLSSIVSAYRSLRDQI